MMTIYELFSTFAKMPQKSDRPMTDAEFDRVKDSVRAMGLKDVRI